MSHSHCCRLAEKIDELARVREALGHEEEVTHRLQHSLALLRMEVKSLRVRRRRCLWPAVDTMLLYRTS